LKCVPTNLDIEIDKTRSTARSGAFGGSIFGGSGGGQSIPSELRDLVNPQQNVSKQLLPVKSSLSTANAEYDRLNDPRNPLPAPPVYAAKLSGLLKHLATAENAVAESVKARKELVAALEKILDTNRAALEADEAQHKQLVARRAEIDSKRQEVELEIIRGMAPEDTSRDGPPLSPGGINDFSEPDRPEMEALTPPAAEDDDETLYDDSTISTGQQNGGGQQQQVQTPVVHHQQHQPSFSAAPGIEMLSNIASQYQSVPVALNGSHKRRRVDSGEDFPDFGGEDIDAEVAEMLRRDSRGS
jgi:regulator of Ty1 transposition protein 103